MYQQVKEEKPLVVIGSPPCTPFSQLQTLNPDTYEKRKRLQEGEEHIKFMISIYKLQVEAGRLFLHEHPAHARSWHMKEVRNLMKEQGVTIRSMYVWAEDLGYQQRKTQTCEEAHQVHDELKGAGSRAGAQV